MSSRYTITKISNFLAKILLTYSWSIREAKRHDLILKMSILGSKSYHPFIAFTNSHLMVGVGEVQLSEPPSLAKPIQQFTNQRQWIFVFDSDIVEILIIYIKAEAPIWLLIKQNRCTGRKFGKPDEVVSQVSFNVSFQQFSTLLGLGYRWV